MYNAALHHPSPLRPIQQIQSDLVPKQTPPDQGKKQGHTTHTNKQNFHIYLHLCSFCMVWAARASLISAFLRTRLGAWEGACT